MPTALVNGARLNYLQIEPQGGGKEDLIMVHGLATSLAFWYLPYASIFAQRYRVTVFDLRGHGRSEMTSGGYTPTALSADLEGLMDHLEIDSAHFVSHSYGGVIALGLARRAPLRVDSLVLADSQLSVTRSAPDDVWAHGAEIQEVLDRLDVDLDAQSPAFGYELLTKVAQMVLEGGELPPELASLVGPTLGRHHRRTAKRWLDLVNMAQHELFADDGLSVSALRAFNFPLLAMYGDRSKACATSTFLRQVWPHADFVTVPGAGHFFPSSRPNEVIAACEAFWNDIEAASSKVA